VHDSALSESQQSISDSEIGDEQPQLDISGSQNLPCCGKHRSARPKPTHVDSLGVPPAIPPTRDEIPTFSCPDPIVPLMNPPHSDLLNVNNMWLQKLTGGFRVFPPRSGQRIYRKTKPTALLDSIVSEMEQEGMLLRTDKLACVIPWFLVAKPSGAARLICDYSTWTNHYKVPPMDLKNIPIVLTTSSAQDYAVKIDLRSGFFQLPLHPTCWKYHGLHNGDTKYVFTRLPMGNSLSPFVMQRTSGALLATIAEIHDL